MKMTDYTTRRGNTAPVRCFLEDRDNRLPRLAALLSLKYGGRWENAQIITLALDTLEGVLKAYEASCT